jgi:hypothetical protein
MTEQVLKIEGGVKHEMETYFVLGFVLQLFTFVLTCTSVYMDKTPADLFFFQSQKLDLYLPLSIQ